MKVKYTITKDGQIVLDFEGFRGKTCIDEFNRIIKALKDNYGIDADIESQEMKPEYYAEQEEVVEQ